MGQGNSTENPKRIKSGTEASGLFQNIPIQESTWKQLIEVTKDSTVCDPTNWKNHNLVSKAKLSNSKSLQASFDNDDSNSFFAKMFYKEKDNFNPLTSEAAVYSCVIPILKQYSTPYLPNFVSFHNCSKQLPYQLEKYLSTLPKDDSEFVNLSMLLKRLKDLEFFNQSKKKDPNSQLSMIINENIKGISFKDWLDKNALTLNPIELKRFLFQNYWNLLVFQQIDFRQNDWHFGNLIVTQVKEDYYFSVSDVVYKIPAGSSCINIDYDHASIYELLQNNGVINYFCPKNDGCFYPNRGYDAFRFFSVFKSVYTNNNAIKQDQSILDLLDELTKQVNFPIYDFEDNFTLPSYTKLKFAETFTHKSPDELAWFTDKNGNNHELFVNIDLESILKENQDKYFTEFIISYDQVPKDAKVYVLPSLKTKEKIKFFLEKYFPQLSPTEHDYLLTKPIPKPKVVIESDNSDDEDDELNKTTELDSDD